MSSYDYVKTSRDRNKEALVDWFGGSCLLCGYDKCLRSLEFHHVDPTEKDFAISRVIGRSIEALANEAKKCILVCSNCHGEIHDGIVDQTLVEEARANIALDVDSFLAKRRSRGARRMWPAHDKFVLLVDKHGAREVAGRFGVTTGYVRKRYKKYAPLV